MDPSRISLRPFDLSDADDFLSWAGDDLVTRYLRWNTIQTRDKALAHLTKAVIPHPWRRSICLDGRSIGYVSARPGSGDDRCRAHISYAMGRDHWGLGITVIALKMAVPKLLVEFPDLVRLEALVEVENRASQTVLEKVGFLKECCLRKYGYCKGEVRDMFIFSFLATDKLTE